MAGREPGPFTYVIVCAALVALTLLTVGVSFLPLSPGWHLALGLTIAAGKAALVLLFFMHVIASSRLTWAVIVVAVFWLVILVGLTLNDYLTRNMVPFTPGH